MSWLETINKTTAKLNFASASLWHMYTATPGYLLARMANSHAYNSLSANKPLSKDDHKTVLAQLSDTLDRIFPACIMPNSYGYSVDLGGLDKRSMIKELAAGFETGRITTKKDAEDFFYSNLPTEVPARLISDFFSFILTGFLVQNLDAVQNGKGLGSFLATLLLIHFTADQHIASYHFAKADEAKTAHHLNEIKSGRAR